MVMMGIGVSVNYFDGRFEHFSDQNGQWLLLATVRSMVRQIIIDD